MKRFMALLLAACLALSLCGCVTQEDLDAAYEEVEELEEQLELAQGDLAQAKKDLQNTKDDLQQSEKEAADLADQKKSLEEQIAQLQDTLEATEKELDDLKNGPDAAIAQIRTAFEAQEWQKVVELANELHGKFAGYDQDIEGMNLAAQAQQTLDDEAAKAAAEAAKTVEDKVHGLIRITKLNCSSPNSAGGVGINLHFINMHPEKTIKYLEVTVVPYNAVGDTQYCDIRDYSRYTCEATGPYAPGKGLTASDNWWWPNAWYNNTIKTIELKGVFIEYMDGTYLSLSNDELQYAIW